MLEKSLQDYFGQLTLDYNMIRNTSKSQEFTKSKVYFVITFARE